MDSAQKIAFISELIENVQRDIIANAPKMPDEWDGHELRRYIADKFEESAMTLGSKGPRGKDFAKRFKAYQNEVLTRNL